MENLDLDIENYSTKDLERFFRMDPKKQDYSPADIELKEYEIREILLKNGNINKRLKRDFIDFLDRAKKILIDVKCGDSWNPTIIPKTWKLDTFQEKEFSQPPPPPITRTGEIIDKPMTPFIYTSNSEFFPGTINPLNTRIISKCLNIDTRFRDNVYSTQSSDFIVQLPTKYSKVVSMQLTSIELPQSFYCISDYYGNNFVYMNVEYILFNFDTTGLLFPFIDDYGEPQIIDITRIFKIPDGNYTSQELVGILNDLLCPKNTNGTIREPVNVFSYIEFSLTPGTGKICIDIKPIINSNNNNIIQKITLDFTRDKSGNPDSIPITQKFGWLLGFIRPIYTGSFTYTAESMIEPTNIRYLFLVVDDYNNNSNNYFESVFQKSLCSPNIIGRISLSTNYFTLTTQRDFKMISEPRKYFGPVDIQRLHIRLIDDNGRIVSMNNSNFSFCLELKMVYDL
jgi:hypothetical protein